MHLARFYNANSRRWEPVRSDEYKAETHGDDLLCGDFNCTAKMAFRKATTTHGGSFVRAAHFATRPHKHHIDDCKMIAGQEPGNQKSSSLKKAVQDGTPVLLNLNMNAGLPLSHHFGSARDAKYLNTPYANWTRKNEYYPVSVTETDSLVNIFNAVSCEQGAEALGNFQIGHQQNIMDFDSFYIGDDEDKIKSLVRSLYMREETALQGQNDVYGFPRLIKFKPTKKEFQKQAHRKLVSGSRVFLNRRGPTALILLQNLCLDSHENTRALLENENSYVVASPHINRESLSSIFKGFRDGQKGNLYISLNWIVNSAAQFCRDNTRQKATNPGFQYSLPAPVI
jgi:hypothetical protein